MPHEYTCKWGRWSRGQRSRSPWLSGSQPKHQVAPRAGGFLDRVPSIGGSGAISASQGDAGLGHCCRHQRGDFAAASGPLSGWRRAGNVALSSRLLPPRLPPSALCHSIRVLWLDLPLHSSCLLHLQEVTIRRRPPHGIEAQACGPVDFKVALQGALPRNSSHAACPCLP